MDASGRRFNMFGPPVRLHFAQICATYNHQHYRQIRVGQTRVNVANRSALVQALPASLPDYLPPVPIRRWTESGSGTDDKRERPRLRGSWIRPESVGARMLNRHTGAISVLSACTPRAKSGRRPADLMA